MVTAFYSLKQSLRMRLVKPFVPRLGGVFEMRYLWSLPHRLDGARFAGLETGFVPTPVEDALRAALAHQARALAA